MITKDDLGEPYLRLADILDIGEICKLEAALRGRQIRFARYGGDAEKEHPELCLLFGREKAGQVARALGGDFVYFPELRASCREKVKSLIREEFNGYNYIKLAERFGYCERHIRAILGGGKTRERQMDGQIALDEID